MSSQQWVLAAILFSRRPTRSKQWLSTFLASRRSMAFCIWSAEVGRLRCSAQV